MGWLGRVRVRVRRMRVGRERGVVGGRIMLLVRW